MGRGVFVTDEQLHLYSGVRVRIPEDGVRLVTRKRLHIGLRETIEIEARRSARRSGQRVFRVRINAEDVLLNPERAATVVAMRIRDRLGLPPFDFSKGRFGW